jgi:hypothetical protein
MNAPGVRPEYDDDSQFAWDDLRSVDSSQSVETNPSTAASPISNPSTHAIMVTSPNQMMTARVFTSFEAKRKLDTDSPLSPSRRVAYVSSPDGEENNSSVHRK